MLKIFASSTLFTLAIPFLLAGEPTFRIEMLHGRRAYVLENERIRASFLQGGGHIAEIRFLDTDAKKRVNPMRVPHYQTLEPYEFNPLKHDALFPDGSHKWLSSGYMGHLLCFPCFGPPSSEEEVGHLLGNHGEAPIVEWRMQKFESDKASVTLWYGADLPRTHYRVGRKVTLAAGTTLLHVEEWVENLLPFDRPVNWVQHATFGPPFVEPGKSFLDVSAVRGQVDSGGSPADSLRAGSLVEWPHGVADTGERVSLRPFQPKAHSGTYFAVLLDRRRPQSFFTMYNDNFPVLIGYLFPTSDHPWLGDFQENQRIESKPWDGQVVTRGIEFGSTPFPEGLRRSVERGTMYGVPTYRWIAAGQRLETSFDIFLAEIPPRFSGVADVTADSGSIVIHERGSDRKINIPGGPVLK